MATMTRLTTNEQLQSALEASGDKPLLIFKHSTRCPISSRANEEVMSYLKDQPNESIEYAIIYVVEDRALSNEAASIVGIKHESPQVILLHAGKPSWHTSHSHITSDALKEQLH
ncbi:bacillithiol system protein YtxJ [Paenibacillus sp. DS2015]|uniref:bacillithiol system redox-active protein YtxJ n=1 Tax=Paenibacillus sp. DS2015 TaxID=3373917 RepID=UPI003D1EDD7D